MALAMPAISRAALMPPLIEQTVSAVVGGRELPRRRRCVEDSGRRRGRRLPMMGRFTR